MSSLVRKAVLFHGEWPERFSEIAERNWHGVVLGGKARTLSVHFMGINLDPSTHSDVACQLVRYPAVATVAWIKEASERLIAGDLKWEWIQAQDFSRQLSNACSVDIVAAMNFPVDTTRMDEVYVVSFILKRRTSVLERL